MARHKQPDRGAGRLALRRLADQGVAPLAAVVLGENGAAEVDVRLHRIQLCAEVIGQADAHHFLAAFQHLAQLPQGDGVGEADDGLGRAHCAAPGRIAPPRHGEEDHQRQKQRAHSQHGQPQEQLADDARPAAAHGAAAEGVAGVQERPAAARRRRRPRRRPRQLRAPVAGPFRVQEQQRQGRQPHQHVNGQHQAEHARWLKYAATTTSKRLMIASIQ